MAAQKTSLKKKSTRARRRTPTKKASSQEGFLSRQSLNPKPGEVIVRMYRQGLGDCFLLAFATDDENHPRFVLIDCGIHMRQTKGRERLLQVMENMTATTNKHLHIVVATHEHSDHLIGFVQKGSPFLHDDLTIDQLWVAWTEKYGDPQADRLREKHGKAREVIAEAVRQARRKAHETSMPGLADRIEKLLGFEEPDHAAFGSREADAVIKKIESLSNKNPAQRELHQRFLSQILTPISKLGAAGNRTKKPSSNELAIGLLAMKAETVYWEPGEIRQVISDVTSIRAIALGPPRTEKLIKKDLPSKVRGGHDHEYKETYLTSLASSRAFALSPALGLSSKVHDDLQHPFASRYRRTLDKKQDWEGRINTRKETANFFRQNYLASDNRWRRIDADWLGVAEDLALDIDNDTNNTSLVLAFELGLPGQGQVLLFAADAQVGNWLSWRDQTYGSGNEKMTVDDLLRRTVLYKVGHHGSHNATAKADPRDGSTPFGLELMNDIIALLPVDRDAADKNMPTPWRMPHEPLYKRLREKANRRVLRSDLKIEPLSDNEHVDIKPTATSWRRVPGKTGISWRKADVKFRAGTEGPLYYDIRLSIPD